MVVLPTPGRPKIKIDFSESNKSRITEIVPNTARPTRQVNPLIKNCRFRIQLIRCNVRSIPARFSLLNLLIL